MRELWNPVLAAAGIAAGLLLRSDAPYYAVVALGGTPLVLQVARKLLARDLGSDLLAAISILASAAMGQWLVAAILVLMLSGGGVLERFASRKASSVLDALARRSPQKAHRKSGGALVDLAVEAVAVGDELVVLPHELCPVDGVVIEGRGAMNESYLTGEPYDLEKAPGSAVLSGSVNGDGALTIRASKLAVDSRYAGIMRVMEDAESRRPRLRRLADQLAVWYIPLTLGTAALTWLASGDPRRALAVLVVATPCPLLIAVPVAVVGAISLAAKRGIIIKDPSVLERITRCRAVIFDKTGTLTYGRPSLTEILPGPGFIPEEGLLWAASLEIYSRHPLAAAIVEAAKNRGLRPPRADRASEKPGEGLSGLVDSRKILVTGRKTAPAAAAIPPASAGLECLVFADGVFAAALRFRDAPRPESRPFLTHLSPLHGIAKVMLVSGDRESEVRYLAGMVGITDIAAGKSPEEKVAIVRRETGLHQTLFVGDGINDAPALAAATVGVAIGTGSDVTAGAAGAVLMTPSISKLDELIHIGDRMRAIALESAVGGMALSLAGMALAAAGKLTPVEGAVLQELIDLAAVLNAARVAVVSRKLTDF